MPEENEGPHLEYFDVAVLLDDEKGENTKEIIAPKKILARNKEAAMLRMIREVPPELEEALEAGLLRVVIVPFERVKEDCNCKSKRSSCYDCAEQDPDVAVKSDETDDANWATFLYKGLTYRIQILRLQNGIGYEPYCARQVVRVQEADPALAMEIAKECFKQRVGW